MATEIFTNDEQMFDRLFVLADDAAYSANPAKEELPRISSQIRDGTPVRTAVPDAVEVRYDAITSVTTNKFGSSLDFSYLQGSEKKSHVVIIKDPEARDVALTALENRLGPRFQRSEVQYGPIRAAVAPLLTAGGIAAFTYIAVRAAQQAAEGEEAVIRGRSRMLKRIFAWAIQLLGPTGVGILGGLLVLGCLAWLVARVKQPPLIITLSPQGAR